LKKVLGASRLRAEHGALTANPVVTAENPLAQAERWAGAFALGTFDFEGFGCFQQEALN